MEVHVESVTAQRRVKKARLGLIRAANDAEDDAEMAREAAEAAARAAAAEAAAKASNSAKVVDTVKTVATTVATTVTSSLSKVFGIEEKPKAKEEDEWDDDEEEAAAAAAAPEAANTAETNAPTAKAARATEGPPDTKAPVGGEGAAEEPELRSAVAPWDAAPSPVSSLAAPLADAPSSAAAPPAEEPALAAAPPAGAPGSAPGSAPASAGQASAGSGDVEAGAPDARQNEGELGTLPPAPAETITETREQGAAEGLPPASPGADSSVVDGDAAPFVPLVTGSEQQDAAAGAASPSASPSPSVFTEADARLSPVRAASPDPGLQFASGRSPPASLGSDGTYTLRILHVNTSELREAIDEARAAQFGSVDVAMLDRMERRLKQAVFAQQGLTIGMSRFVGRLRMLTAKRRRREAAVLALSQAVKDCEAEVDRLRQVRPRRAHLEGENGLLMALQQALIDARREDLEVEAAEATFADTSALSEFRNAATQRLSTACDAAVECTEFFWRSTQDQMELAKAELSEAASHADKALVDREACEFAKGALQRLSKLFGKREAALGRMREAAEELQASTDEGQLEQLADELKMAIGIAEKASVEQAQIDEARQALERATSGASLAKDLAACKEAIEFVHKFSASEMGTKMLRDNVAVLSHAVARAKACSVDPERLAAAEKDLKEASRLVAKHDKAHAELSKWMAATELAHERVNNDLCRSADEYEGNPSLKECVFRLDEAIDKAEKGKVPVDYVDKAQRILAPARATAKFGKVLQVGRAARGRDDADDLNA